VSVRVFRTESEDETIALGRALAKELPARCVVLLIGNLGAGKTTLAKGIADGLGAAAPDEVSSPTFTLIHEYGPRVFHVDLYRLETAEEAAALGLEELFEQDAVTLIEWGERFPELLPEERLEITIETECAEGRKVTVQWFPPCPHTSPE